MKRIIEDLKTGNLKNAYLLFGEEDYLIRQYRSRLADAVCPPDDTMNRTEYAGKGIDVRELSAQAMTMPFFAERRVILVENSGFFTKGSDDVLELLKALPESTVLIFCESGADKRTKLYKYISKTFCAVEFSRLKDDALMKWILTILGSEGKKITRPVMELFLSRTGDDMYLIRNELDKLLAYCLDREIITAEDVRAVCSNQIQENIFAMVDAISVQDQKKALALYHDLLVLREPALRILALITRQFHNLMRMKDMLQNGCSDAQIASGVRLPPFVVKKQRGILTRMTQAALNKSFALCLDIDEQIKSGLIRDQIGVELLIVQLSGGTGRTPHSQTCNSES